MLALDAILPSNVHWISVKGDNGQTQHIPITSASLGAQHMAQLQMQHHAMLSPLAHTHLQQMHQQGQIKTQRDYAHTLAIASAHHNQVMGGKGPINAVSLRAAEPFMNPSQHGGKTGIEALEQEAQTSQNSKALHDYMRQNGLLPSLTQPLGAQGQAPQTSATPGGPVHWVTINGHHIQIEDRPATGQDVAELAKQAGFDSTAMLMLARHVHRGTIQTQGDLVHTMAIAAAYHDLQGQSGRIDSKAVTFALGYEDVPDLEKQAQAGDANAKAVVDYMQQHGQMPFTTQHQVPPGWEQTGPHEFHLQSPNGLHGKIAQSPGAKRWMSRVIDAQGKPVETRFFQKHAHDADNLADAFEHAHGHLLQGMPQAGGQAANTPPPAITPATTASGSSPAAPSTSAAQASGAASAPSGSVPPWQHKAADNSFHLQDKGYVVKVWETPRSKHWMVVSKAPGATTWDKHFFRDPKEAFDAAHETVYGKGHGHAMPDIKNPQNLPAASSPAPGATTSSPSPSPSASTPASPAGASAVAASSPATTGGPQGGTASTPATGTVAAPAGWQPTSGHNSFEFKDPSGHKSWVGEGISGNWDALVFDPDGEEVHTGSYPSAQAAFSAADTHLKPAVQAHQQIFQHWQPNPNAPHEWEREEGVGANQMYGKVYQTPKGAWEGLVQTPLTNGFETIAGSSRKDVAQEINTRFDTARQHLAAQHQPTVPLSSTPPPAPSPATASVSSAAGTASNVSPNWKAQGKGLTYQSAGGGTAEVVPTRGKFAATVTTVDPQTQQAQTHPTVTFPNQALAQAYAEQHLRDVEAGHPSPAVWQYKASDQCFHLDHGDMHAKIGVNPSGRWLAMVKQNRQNVLYKLVGSDQTAFDMAYETLFGKGHGLSAPDTSNKTEPAVISRAPQSASAASSTPASISATAAANVTTPQPSAQTAPPPASGSSSHATASAPAASPASAPSPSGAAGAGAHSMTLSPLQKQQGWKVDTNGHAIFEEKGHTAQVVRTGTRTYDVAVMDAQGTVVFQKAGIQSQDLALMAARMNLTRALGGGASVAPLAASAKTATPTWTQRASPHPHDHVKTADGEADVYETFGKQWGAHVRPTKGQATFQTFDSEKEAKEFALKTLTAPPTPAPASTPTSTTVPTLSAQAPATAPATASPIPTRTDFTKSSAVTGQDLNGVPFTPVDTTAYKQWKDIPLNAPAKPPLNGSIWRSTGMIVLEDDGRLWLAQGSNGYPLMFPKGREEAHLTDQQNALKELSEEVGLNGEITGFLGDFNPDHTQCRFFIGKRTGGQPTDFHWETQSTHLVTIDEARKMLMNDPGAQNKSGMAQLLDAVETHLKTIGKHPSQQPGIVPTNALGQPAPTPGTWKPDPKVPTKIEFKKGQSLTEDDDIDGVPFTPTDKQAYMRTPDVPVNAPPRPPTSSSQRKFDGAIFVEGDGRIWVRRHANGADVHFARGGEEGWLTEQQNALKHVADTTGLNGKITGFLGDYSGASTNTRLFVGQRTGGTPTDTGPYTSDVYLVTIDEAKKMVRPQDRAVLDDLETYLQQHPPAPPTPKKASYQNIMASPGSQPGTYRGQDGVEREVHEDTSHTQTAAYTEHLANQIYRALGIEAAKSRVFEMANGKKAVALDRNAPTPAKLSKATAQAFLKGFAADVLLGNRNAMDWKQGHVVEENGQIVRQHNGNVLLHSDLPAAPLRHKSEIEDLNEWQQFGEGRGKGADYHNILQKAGYKDATELPGIVSQVNAIKSLRDSAGGWQKFVEENTKGLDSAHQKALANILDTRTKQLEEKAEEVRKLKGVHTITRNAISIKDGHAFHDAMQKILNDPVFRRQTSSYQPAKTSWRGTADFTKQQKNVHALAQMAGYTGAPQVVTKSEIDDMVRDGSVPVYRCVVDAGKLKAADILDLLRHGDYHIGGKGQRSYGQGIYFASASGSTPAERSRNEPKARQHVINDYGTNGLYNNTKYAVIRGALHKEAKLLDHDKASRIATGFSDLESSLRNRSLGTRMSTSYKEAQPLVDWYNQELDKIDQQQTSGTSAHAAAMQELRDKATFIADVFSDKAAVAVLKGYDGLEHKIGSGYYGSGGYDYAPIVNRTALALQDTNS